MINKFDPTKSLLELKIVQYTLFATVLTTIIITIAIVSRSNLCLDFSYAGFNKFIEIFKLPIGILGLNIPMIALYGANHRSEQTKTQITIGMEQNHFTNKFKHFEEFEKHCQRAIEKLNDIIERSNRPIKDSRHAVFDITRFTHLPVHQVRTLYRKIFGSNPKQNFKAEPTVQNSLDKYILEILSHTDGFLTENQDSWQNSVTQIKKVLDRFVLEYGIHLEQPTFHVRPLSTTHENFHFNSVDYFLRSVFHTFSVIDFALEFDSQYERSRLVSQSFDFQIKPMQSCLLNEDGTFQITPFNVREIFELPMN